MIIKPNLVKLTETYGRDIYVNPSMIVSITVDDGYSYYVGGEECIGCYIVSTISGAQHWCKSVPDGWLS